MGSRRTGNGVENVYNAAQVWVERALRTDDSLFTPGQAIWTSHWLGELRKRFLDRPDHGSDSTLPNYGASSGLSGQLPRFLGQLKVQLEDSPPEVYQLIGEVFYVEYLIILPNQIGVQKKKGNIEEMLNWGALVKSIPNDTNKLAEALEPGILKSTPLTQRIPYQVAFIIEFAEQLKGLSPTARKSVLVDPWKFKDFAANLDCQSQLLRNNQNMARDQREALLHLVHPDTFEGIVSTDHKNGIANAFAEYVKQPTDDVDRKLHQIRPHLEEKYGKNIHLYEPAIRSVWDPSAPSPWDDFVRRAKAYVGSGKLGPEETDYKTDIGRRLADAKEAVLSGQEDWSDLVKRALFTSDNNLIHFIVKSKLRDWINNQPDGTVNALKALWAQEGESVSKQIGDFCGWLTPDISGQGTYANVASVLLMGLDVELYPPFKMRTFEKAYDLTGYSRPEARADAGALYEHALDFLDRFIVEASERDLPISHRLDAQGIVWGVLGEPAEGDEELDDDTDPTMDFAALANELYLPADFFEEINTLLEDKKQVIFQGPPGTGKTYVARKLAKHIAGSEDRVTLVQFHPSYDYVDFVQGYRPAPMENGQPGLKLRDGPLLRVAKDAESNPGSKYFLIIDEINRGNLSKVFGELYFLLEYRNEGIELQYSERNERFSLPENLYIIGTMNMADRSIARVDLALRRRFYFVEFHPADEEIGSVLREYLAKNASDMGWVADVVDKANQQLQQDERDAAIGPSYFMKENLNEGDVVIRWKHSVMPYIRELLFGQDSRIADFQLDYLRGNAPAPQPAPTMEDTDSDN